MARKKFTTEIIDGGVVLALRSQLGLTQGDFWKPLGVTQSGGSRYEGERGMPDSVKVLVQLAYGSEKQAVELLARLRAKTPNSQGPIEKIPEKALTTAQQPTPNGKRRSSTNTNSV